MYTVTVVNILFYCFSKSAALALQTGVSKLKEQTGDANKYNTK